MIIDMDWMGEPTIEGVHGRAWRCESLNSEPKKETCLAVWVIEAPAAHPAWSSYVLSLVHLRPTVESPNPLIYRDGASHELVLYALHPNLEKNNLQLLYPANFAAQLALDSDNDAELACAEAVRDICDGKLSPDTDFLSSWIARFGDSMIMR